MPKQKVIPRKKHGARLIFTLRMPANSYNSPIQILNEGLLLCHYKTVSPEELREFARRLKAKTAEVTLGRTKRKWRKTQKPSANGQKYIEFQRWARRVGEVYSKELFQLFKDSYPEAPVWESEVVKPAQS
jgi:hypothetical protein